MKPNESIEGLIKEVEDKKTECDKHSDIGYCWMTGVLNFKNRCTKKEGCSEYQDLTLKLKALTEAKLLASSLERSERPTIQQIFWNVKLSSVFGNYDIARR